MMQGGLLLCFFLFFLAPAEVAAGLLALAVDAFSLGIAFRVRLSFWGRAMASVMGLSIRERDLTFGGRGHLH